MGLQLLAAITLLVWCNIVRIWALNITYRWWDLGLFNVDHILSLLSPFMIVDFYFYWLAVGAGAHYDVDREKRLVEQHEEQLRTQLAQAELAALRQQLQPHFLFNSLNAVSSLMREGAFEKAVEAIALLSQLLRDLLSHTGQQEIELRRECPPKHERASLLVLQARVRSSVAQACCKDIQDRFATSCRMKTLDLWRP